VSEWLVFLGLFDAVGAGGLSAWAAGPAAMLLGVTGALALACFVKVCGVVFFGTARTEAAQRAHECGPLMRGPMLVLAAVCIAIGLAPVLFWPAVAHAVAAWQPGWAMTASPAPLAALGACQVALAFGATLGAILLWRRVRRNGVARAVTWDGGYATPTPRMQYTAGSFAEIITGWFDWILRPQRHSERPQGIFPAHASHREHTPETVLEYVVEPAGEAVMTVAATVRRLQHGRLQFYILYLVIGMAGLAALVMAGGGR